MSTTEWEWGRLLGFSVFLLQENLRISALNDIIEVWGKVSKPWELRLWNLWNVEKASISTAIHKWRFYSNESLLNCRNKLHFLPLPTDHLGVHPQKPVKLPIHAESHNPQEQIDDLVVPQPTSSLPSQLIHNGTSRFPAWVGSNEINGSAGIWIEPCVGIGRFKKKTIDDVRTINQFNNSRYF